MISNTERVTSAISRMSTLATFVHRWHKHIWRFMLLASDALVLGIAFLLAYWLRFDQGFTLRPEVVPNYGFYASSALYIVPGWLALFWLQRLYDYHYLLGGTEEYRRVFNACTIGIMVVMTFSFLAPSFVVARGWLVFGWVLSVSLVILSRAVLRRVAYGLRSRGLFVDHTLIIGTNSEAEMLVERCGDCRLSGLEIVGLVEPRVWQTDETRDRTVGGLPVVGGLGMLPAVVEMNRIDKVIIASTAVRRHDLIQISSSLASYPDIEIQITSGMYEFLTTGMVVTTKNSVPLIGINRLRLSWGEQTLKSLFDRSCILLSLPFLLPIFAGIALLVRIDSPGPILYRRRVLGLGGKEFDAFKFRSMYVDGDEILNKYPEMRAEFERTQKLRSDPRVTTTGSWLRRTSLDELPQLINVMKGQMSLVGPRMISPEESHLYGAMGMNLLTVKPGMTGMWQVSGRSDLTYEQRVRLDMYYIRNYSIWLDVQILFVQTLPSVLKRRGAY